MDQLKPFSPILNEISVAAQIVVGPRQLILSFQLEDPRALILDSLQPGVWTTWERADELWKTTCCEVFFGRPDEKSYWELNLSPGKMKWNLYFFDDYRTPQPPKRANDFTLSSIRVSQDLLTCKLISKSEIPSLQASLCAVIRTKSGPQYYSVTHAAEKPDFHDRRSFVLSL